MRSMTGFGASSAALGSSRIVVEVRTVNARSLDVRMKMPDLFADATLWAEQLVRSRLRRGRVEITVAWEGDAGPTFSFDRPRAIAALRAFLDVGQELGIEAAPPLSVLASVPGLFGGQRALPDAKTAAGLALGQALGQLDADRAREGKVIADELASRAELVLAAVERASKRAATLPAAMRARLSERIGRLENVSLDPARLEAEVALYAERYDVSEELSRLATHMKHFQTLVGRSKEDDEHAHGHGKEPEPEGRRLDFILQEAMREATTLAVKAQDAQVSADVVEMKVELERMREQVQNVE